MFSGKKYTYKSYVQLARSLRTELWQQGSCDEDVVIVMDSGTDQVHETNIPHVVSSEFNWVVNCVLFSVKRYFQNSINAFNII